VPEKAKVIPSEAKVSPAKNVDANALVTKKLLGNWKGDKATQITKYFDFEFNENGKGERNEIPFYWKLSKKDNGEILTVSWFRTITTGEYNNIRSNADEMMPKGNNTTTYITNGKKESVMVNDGQFYLITGMEVFKVAVLTNKKLVLSVKATNGKTINTYHSKN